jgi:hypothetical protein
MKIFTKILITISFSTTPAFAQNAVNATTSNYKLVQDKIIISEDKKLPTMAAVEVAKIEEVKAKNDDVKKEEDKKASEKKDNYWNDRRKNGDEYWKSRDEKMDDYWRDRKEKK